MSKFRVIELPQELDVTAPHLLKIFVAQKIAIQQWIAEKKESPNLPSVLIVGKNSENQWGWFSVDDDMPSPIQYVTINMFKGYVLSYYTMHPYMGVSANWHEINEQLDFDKYAK